MSFRYEVQHFCFGVAICSGVAIVTVTHSGWMKFVSAGIPEIFHLHDISFFYGTLPSVWSTAVLGCLYCFQSHSQICRTSGTFYNPAFSLGLWEDWEKCWNYPSLTQNHTLLILQSKPLAYVSCMIYFFTHDPHFFKSSTFLFFWC